jgi:hypothetical protein
MDAKAPLPPLAGQEPTWALAAILAGAWGLNQFADRLHEKVQRSQELSRKRILSSDDGAAMAGIRK